MMQLNRKFVTWNMVITINVPKTFHFSATIFTPTLVKLALIPFTTSMLLVGVMALIIFHTPDHDIIQIAKDLYGFLIGVDKWQLLLTDGTMKSNLRMNDGKWFTK
jgi:hypothetical protein